VGDGAFPADRSFERSVHPVPFLSLAKEDLE